MSNRQILSQIIDVPSNYYADRYLAYNSYLTLNLWQQERKKIKLKLVDLNLRTHSP